MVRIHKRMVKVKQRAWTKAWQASQNRSSHHPQLKSSSSQQCRAKLKRKMTTSLNQITVHQTQKFCLPKGHSPQLSVQCLNKIVRKLTHSIAILELKLKSSIRSWIRQGQRVTGLVKCKRVLAFLWHRHCQATASLIVNLCRSLLKVLTIGHLWVSSVVSKPMRLSKACSKRACRNLRISYS